MGNVLPATKTAGENYFARKLESFGPLGDEDRRLLDRIASNPQRVSARINLIREGDKPEHVLLITEGFACRYKHTDDGKRSIMAYLVPGDFCDLHVAVLGEMDHSIATLSACSVVRISREDVNAMVERPGLARLLWLATLVDEAVLREWLVNVGIREAPKALAHLLCELLFRLRVVGLADGGRYTLPITQEELGDTVGLSTVHINRTIQTLRAQGLITLEAKLLTIISNAMCVPAQVRVYVADCRVVLRNGLLQSASATACNPKKTPAATEAI